MLSHMQYVSIVMKRAMIYNSKYMLDIVDLLHVGIIVSN